MRRAERKNVSGALSNRKNQPPPQALRFSHRRGERETRVTGDEPQGTMGRVQTAGEATSRPSSPFRLPLRAHFFIERETSGYEAAVSTVFWYIENGPLEPGYLKY